MNILAGLWPKAAPVAAEIAPAPAAARRAAERDDIHAGRSGRRDAVAGRALNQLIEARCCGDEGALKANLSFQTVEALARIEALLTELLAAVKAGK